jgi:hypothetical protein
MSVSDLVRKFKRGATDPEAPPIAKKSFDWEPERAMPTPRSSSSKAAEPAPAAPKPAAVTWQQQQQQQQRPAGEPSSVIGTGIPADVSDFAVVYKGAAVQPPSHGYGVDRIADMLAHGSLAGLDKNVKASAVLAALDAAGVSIEDVIHDGVLRYKALVAFEAAKELELQQVRPRNERRVEELKAKVAAFEKEKQAEIDALMREAAAAVSTLTRLQTRQRAEEERFHRTVSLFVEPLPGRVIPMGARPETPSTPAAPPPAAPAPAPEAKSELKLVAPAAPAPAAAAKPAENTPAAPPTSEPGKDEAKS